MKDVIAVWSACSFLYALCVSATYVMDYADIPREETVTEVAFSAPACYPDMREEEL